MVGKFFFSLFFNIFSYILYMRGIKKTTEDFIKDAQKIHELIKEIQNYIDLKREN